MTQNTYAVPAGKSPQAALNDLATDINDVIRGYKEIEDRGDDNIQQIAEDLRSLHEAHAAELLALIDQMGGNAEDTGSFMGDVHVAVATARDWFGMLDSSAIDSLVDGENRLLESYDKAARKTADHEAIQAKLVAQRESLSEKVEALKSG